MGKTEGGAVWLDAEKTPPFDFFQYWRNIEDDMVMKCLNYLTEVEDSELVELGKLQGSEINQVKIRLAFEVTKLVHGEEEAIKSKETAASLFAGGGAPLDVPQVFVKRTDFRDNMDVGSFLVLAGIVPSKKEVTRLIEQGGLFVADKKVETIKEVVSQDAVHEGVLIRRGKKHYYRVLFSD
jgi:tyrosyl-tRNA synthetase